MVSCTEVEVGECARRLYSVDEGEAGIRRAVDLSRAVGEPVPLAFVTQYLSTLLAERGQADEATALAQTVMDLGGTATTYHALGLVSLALAELHTGDLAGALAHARDAHANMHAIGARSYFPHVDVPLLRVLVAAGDGAAAGVLADEALAVLAGLGTMGLLEMPLRLAAARAHVCAGRRDDAARGVAEALVRLHARAERVPDPDMRRRFLADVPEHAELFALAAEVGVC